MRHLSLPARILILTLCLGHAAKAEPGLSFVQNDRQWPEQVQYRADLPGGAVFFTPDRFVYSYYSTDDLARIVKLEEQNKDVGRELIHGHAYQVIFAGCNSGAAVSGSNKRPYCHNYFLGSDPSKWSAQVPVFEGVRYDDLYAGIDLAVYSNGPSMKYDFIVATGADPSLIRLQFKGVTPRLTAEGTIEIKTSVNTVVEQAPYVYQLIEGQKKEVKCRYTLNSKGTISFAFPEGYDKSRELIVDPSMVFATWSGSTAQNWGGGTSYDQAGNAYTAGAVYATGWPATVGAFQTSFMGATDVAINKYNSTGTALIYSTYLGGSDIEHPQQLVVNSANELVLVGGTYSTDFPVTAGCYDNTLNGASDYFVTRINAAGSALLGSTYLGGGSEEYAWQEGDVTLDPSGNIVGAGWTTSTDFPVTAGAYQSAISGLYDVSVFKLDPGCTSLLASTYLGGTGYEHANSVKVAGNGNIVVCGRTSSNDFPTTAGTINPAFLGGTEDGYVSILNPGATSLLHSTFMGTSGVDGANQLHIDGYNRVYVAGHTTGVYPVTPGLYTQVDGTTYIHLLSSSLTDIKSTRVGPAVNYWYYSPFALLVDDCENVSLAFYTWNDELPITPDAYDDTGNIYIMQITAGMTTLNYASYLNASNYFYYGHHGAFDPSGNLYATHHNAGIATTPGAWCPTSLVGGTLDGLTFKFHLGTEVADAQVDIDGNDTGCAPFTVNFVNNSSGTLTYYWDFGNGDTSTAVAPTYTYADTGVYHVMLAVKTTGTCLLHDTVYTTIVVRSNYANAVGSVVDDTGCVPFQVQTVNNSTGAASYEWDFGDGSPLVAGAAPTHLYPTPGRYRVVLHAFDASLCGPSRTDTFYVKVLAPGPVADIDLQVSDSGCAPYQAILDNLSAGASTYLWQFGDGATSTAQYPGSHLYSNTGIYEVVLYARNYDSLVCKPADTDRVTIHVFPPVLAGMTVSDTMVCEGSAIAFGAELTNTFATVAWDFGDGVQIPDRANLQHVYDSNGRYAVTLTVDHIVCPDTLLDTFVAVVPVPPTVLGRDTSICLYGEPVVLTNAAYNPANQHVWNTGDNTQAILARHHGIFWLRTTNEAGCSSTDSVEVLKSCYLDIPNAFTPNGDGTNDFFFPRQLLSQKVTGFRMQVFNRWGQIVFQTDKIDGRGWDGRFNDKDQPQGVYIYLIDAEIDGTRKENYKGNVTLLR